MDSTRIIDLETMVDVLGGQVWAHEGSVFMRDAAKGALMRLDQDGKPRNRVGRGLGDGPGEIRQLIDVSFRPGSVFLFDPNARKILQFSLDGMYINTRKVGDLYRTRRRMSSD